MKASTFLFLSLPFLLITQQALLAAESESIAVTARVKAYAEAFNKGDAKALAAFWASDATWTDPRTGESVVGREKIQSGFEELFKANKGARLELEVQSIKFLTADVALEEGVATVSVPDMPPSKSGYTAVQVKKGGQWLIERVIETTDGTEPAVEPAGTGASEKKGPLKDIAWLEGTWIDEGDESTIYFDNQWVAGGNFLSRTFDVVIRDRVDIHGLEIVGWDAVNKQIRSWVFDSDGAFAELTWRRQKDNPGQWTKSAKGTLSSGDRVTATHVMKKVDDDTYTFEAVGRERNGELLENIDEVTVVRTTASPDSTTNP